MDESGIGPDPSGPDSGKSSHPMASGKDALMLQIVTSSCVLIFFWFDKEFLKYSFTHRCSDVQKLAVNLYSGVGI
jgi:ABC-type Mn2+/Zn2+ transport system permease subunit